MQGVSVMDPRLSVLRRGISTSTSDDPPSPLPPVVPGGRDSDARVYRQRAILASGCIPSSTSRRIVLHCSTPNQAHRLHSSAYTHRHGRHRMYHEPRHGQACAQDLPGKQRCGWKRPPTRGGDARNGQVNLATLASIQANGSERVGVDRGGRK